MPLRKKGLLEVNVVYRAKPPRRLWKHGVRLQRGIRLSLGLLLLNDFQQRCSNIQLGTRHVRVSNVELTRARGE